MSGATYWVRLGGNNGAQGNGILTISVDEPSGGGGNCDNPATGADVIVGALTGPSNYTGQGGVGAYSIGTTSCNTGTVPLDWFANNTSHPVIGQNIYRFEGNTFELIGMSYLKHGFTALQGNLCCACSPNPNGTRLGVGCSDPYGSGLNGSQGGLGPRWQVNAHTGAFSYPFSQQGQGGNSIFKRIQVQNSDLDPFLHSSARIVGEGQYIAPDDAAAGNGNNNCSWREMAVSTFENGRWTLGFTGDTVREDPAIRAWQTFDPTVQLTDVQLPNEGLFIVGNKVADNGNGTWHYDYAVYNMNSHDSCGSFSVPVPAGRHRHEHRLPRRGLPLGRALRRHRLGRRSRHGRRHLVHGQLRDERERERDPLGNALQLPLPTPIVRPRPVTPRWACSAAAGAFPQRSAVPSARS